MSEKIEQLLEQATEVQDDLKSGVSYAGVDYKVFSQLILNECFLYLNKEIQRLQDYYKLLPDKSLNEKHEVELCIEKCYDNIEGLKSHFGIK